MSRFCKYVASTVILATVASCSYAQGQVATPSDAEVLLRSSCQAEIARHGAEELRELAIAKLTEVANDKSGDWQPKLDMSRTLAGMAKQFSRDAANMGLAATDIDAAVEWFKSAEGQRIAAAVCTGIESVMAKSPAEKAVPVSSQRHDLLRRIATTPIWSAGLTKQGYAVAQASDVIEHLGSLKNDSRAMDKAMDSIVIGAPDMGDLPSGYFDSVAEHLLAPAFARLSDADLSAYTEFLERPQTRKVTYALHFVPAGVVSIAMGTVVRPVLWQYIPADVAMTADQQADAANKRLAAAVDAAERAIANPTSRDVSEHYDALHQDAHDHPNDVRLQYVFGRIALRRSLVFGRPEMRLVPTDPFYLNAASGALERAVAVDAPSADALHYLGYVRFLQKRFADADHLYQKARSVGFGGSDDLLDQGDLLFEQGQLEQALSLHLQALAAKPWQRSNALAFYALAYSDANAKNVETIVKAFDQYLGQPHVEGVEKGWYADMFLRSGADFERARNVLERDKGPQSGFEQRLLAEALIIEAAVRYSDKKGFLGPEGHQLLQRATTMQPNVAMIVDALLRREHTASAVVVMARAGLIPEGLYNGEPLLSWAIRNDRIDVAEQVADAGIDVNRVGLSGTPALQLAVMKKQPKLVRALLERGADPERKDAEGKRAIDRLDNDGSTQAREILTLLSAK